MQRVIEGRPPIFEAAREVFGPVVERAIFSWGDKIYNLSGFPLSPALKAHEAVHGERQLADGVERWWQDYLVDPRFRLIEEGIAHRAEYETAVEGGNRLQRRSALKVIAGRLSGPMYGHMLTKEQAKRLITRPEGSIDFSEGLMRARRFLERSARPA